MRLSLTRWRLLATLSLGWALVVCVLYANLVEQLTARKLRALAAVGKDLFFWQVAGFLILVVFATIRSHSGQDTGLAAVRRTGRLTGCWLALSTLALLVSSRDAWLALKLAAFVLWFLATVRSLQLAIERFAGSKTASWGFAAATLYGCGILIAFFIGLLGMTAFWPVATIALAAALPGAATFLSHPVATGQRILRGLDRLNPLGAVAFEAIWVCLALAFVWASSPESFSDSIRSYLPDVQAMARHHSLAPQLVDVGRLMPRALQAFCAMGYVVGSFHLAKWLSWFALVPLAALIHEEIRRRSGNPNLGAIAAAATLACPLLLSLSTTLMYDHVMTMLCVAGFFGLARALHQDHQRPPHDEARRARSDDPRRAVLLSAFLMGTASAIKYNFLIFDLVWGLFLTAYAIRTRGFWRGLQWCIAPALILGLAASPWYVYNWITLGNPVFPFLNDAFESPLWPPGHSTGLKVDRFVLGEGVWNPLLFPWTVTFHTSRVLQGHDGRMGLVLLALLPWAMTVRRSLWRNGLDLGLAGLAIIVGVCSLTSYARYWLPGFPLLLVPLFLALGAGVDRAGWRLPRWATPVAVPALLAVLCLQIPFWTASLLPFPWPAYTQQISARDWTQRLSRGLPAIEALNRILEPRDRVLATTYSSIHTIAGDAYEFPFWYRKFYDIEDRASFDAYVERSGIRYWVVDFTNEDFTYFDLLLDAKAHYWSDPRLVAGDGNVAVFDLSPAPRQPGFSHLESRQIPAMLEAPASPGESIDAEGWRDRFPNDPSKASKNLKRSLKIQARGEVNYLFSVAPGSTLVRATVELRAPDHLRAVQTQIEWLDASRQAIGKPVVGGLHSRRKKLETLIFARAPETARFGRLRISRQQRLVLRLKSLRLDFLADAENAS